MPTICIISFGYLHQDAPEGAHLVVDLRHHFRDPAPALVDLSFPDERVRDRVLATPGIGLLTDASVLAADAFAAGPGTDDVVLAVGCAGGQHRAPTVASEVCERLRIRGHSVDLVHRDLRENIDHGQEQGEVIDIDSPIEMPPGAVDFTLPVRPRSTEDDSQARARMEALVEAWGASGTSFTASQLATALRDREGLTRPRSWIQSELRRLEESGCLESDDYGRWHPAA